MRGRLPLLMSLAVLLLLAVLATRGSSAVPHGKGLVILGRAVSPQASPAVVPANQLPGRLNPVVGIGLSTAIVIALVAYLIGMVMVILLIASLRFHRRRRDLRRSEDTTEDADGGDGTNVLTLLRGTRSALAGLRQRAGGPPSDAVQRAWLALEAAAAESGTARRPDQTSTEFTSAVLAGHAVDPAALATLRGLYQRARFGLPDSVTDADADAAVVALDRIADTLAAGVGVGSG